MVDRFTVWYGGVLCGRAVYYVAVWCCVWWDSVLCGRVVYCMVGQCTVC